MMRYLPLHATSGGIRLQGLVSSPNAIYLRQEGVGTGQTISGQTRIQTKQLRIEAEGDVDVFTDVYEVRGSSETGNFFLDEMNDIEVTSLQAPNGSISLTANGVDLGGESINPIALTARIIEGTNLYVSAPNGSMDIDIDTSSDLNLMLDPKADQNTPAVPMQAAGSVKIINASGSILVGDGPVAGLSAKIVKAASSERLNDAYRMPQIRQRISRVVWTGAFPFGVLVMLTSELVIDSY